MNLNDKIYIAGHTGLVGSAIVRQLKERGFSNLLMRTHKELDLINQLQVQNFFTQESPDYVILAAAKVTDEVVSYQDLLKEQQARQQG